MVSEVFCAITSWYQGMAGACLALPEEENTRLLALQSMHMYVCDTRMYVCLYTSRSRITDLSSPQFNGPLASSPWKREKGVLVLIVVLPPSASLSHINIHSIDLFSELTKKTNSLPGNLS